MLGLWGVVGYWLMGIFFLYKKKIFFLYKKKIFFLYKQQMLCRRICSGGQAPEPKHTENQLHVNKPVSQSRGWV